MSDQHSELKAAVAGSVLLPTDDGYDAAQGIFNSDHELPATPAVVVMAHDDADVMAAVKYARANALEIAIRGGKPHG